MKDDKTTSPFQQSRKEVLAWAKTHLVGQSLPLVGTSITLTFTMRGIKEAINQPHRHYIEKNLAIKDIHTLLGTAAFVKEEQDNIREEFSYRYYRTFISREESFIVLRSNRYTGITDFYSIVDKIKE